MMTFTQLPDNYASLYGSLRYRFEGDGDPRTLTVEIRDNLSGEVIHRKELYNTTSGEIDLAPLLRYRLTPTPQSSSIGFLQEDLQRWITVEVSVEEALALRTFLLCEEEPCLVPLLGSMPLNRRIRLGEWEELTFLGEITRVMLSLTTTDGVVSDELESPANGVKPRLFRFDTGRFPASTTDFQLHVYNGTSLLTTLDYTVQRGVGGARVAWIDRRGALQHYTFPSVSFSPEEQQRVVVERSEGERLTVATGYEQPILVTSDYEMRSTRLALMELGTARHSWVLTSTGDYLAVEAALQPAGRVDTGPMPLSFELRSTLKDRSLWSCL